MLQPTLWGVIPPEVRLYVTAQSWPLARLACVFGANLLSWPLLLPLVYANQQFLFQPLPVVFRNLLIELHSSSSNRPRPFTLPSGCSRTENFVACPSLVITVQSPGGGIILAIAKRGSRFGFWRQNGDGGKMAFCRHKNLKSVAFCRHKKGKEQIYQRMY